MSISFAVGDGADIFATEFATSSMAILRQLYPFATRKSDEPYYSDEIPAAGWRQLQERVGVSVPQVADMDAYQAVYVPGGGPQIEQVIVPGAADPLQVGNLDLLLEELQRFAADASLPTDDIELMERAARYLEDDELFDRDLDLQTFVQLMLSARQASARNDALWIRS